MNKNYLKYLVESKKIGWIFFAIMYVAISLFTRIMSYGDSLSRVEGAMYTAFVLSIALCVVLPIMQYSFIHNKKSVDTFFALPISRKEMLCTNFLFQFGYIFGLFVITSILTALPSMRVLHIEYFACALVHSGVTFAVLLLFMTALYLIANNVLDGIVMIAAYSFMPVILMLSVEVLGNVLMAGSMIGSITEKVGLYTSPWALGFVNMVNCMAGMEGSDITAGTAILQGILLVGYGVISAILVYRHFVQRKTERAEQISDDRMSYPFVIHIYLVLVLACLGTLFMRKEYSTYIIFWLMLLTVYIIAMFVYMRKISINLKGLLRYIILTAATLALCLAGWSTKGFGLSYKRFLPETGNICYRYSTNYYEDSQSNTNDSISVDFELSIPVSQLEEYQEVYTLMEEIRTEFINEYYEHPDMYWGSYFATFDKYAKQNYSEEKNYRGYTGGYRISWDDLQIIDRYGTVTVYAYDASTDMYRDYSLKEYLEGGNDETNPE